MSSVVVAAFYQFFAFPDYYTHRRPLKTLMEDQSIRGTVLLAHEGINGTVAGSRKAIDALLSYLRAIPGAEALEHKESLHDAPPFGRAKVKLKKELISLGVPASPLRAVGEYVTPEQWNALIREPDVLIVDARNDYEVHLGTFKGAQNPQTETFKELAEYTKAHLNPARHTRIATFCTGGIRCEKYTSYLKEIGFEQVYHLQGGILKYLEEIPKEQSLWEGECYVFDERVAVGHRLVPSETASMCAGCGRALTPEDRAHPAYREGKCCGFCANA